MRIPLPAVLPSMVLALSIAPQTVAQPLCDFVEEQVLRPSDGATASVVAHSGDVVALGSTGGAGAVYLFELVDGRWLEVARLTASDGALDDGFGEAIAMDGNVLAVGAPYDDDLGESSGAVYVFERLGLLWFQTAKLEAADRSAGDRFGSAVAVSGYEIVVGAEADDDQGSNSGAAYVYQKQGAFWHETAKLTNAQSRDGDLFGAAIAMSDELLVIGALGVDKGFSTDAGTAYVYERPGTAWEQVTELVPLDGAAFDLFGSSLSVHGQLVLAGSRNDDSHAQNCGSAYLFARSDGWGQVAKLCASDASADARLGWSVSLAEGMALLGAPGAGAVYYFRQDGDVWVQTAKFAPRDGSASFGRSVSISSAHAFVAGTLDAYSLPATPRPSFAAFGTGCDGSGGFIPTLNLSGCLSPDGDLTLTLLSGIGGGTALFFAGNDRGPGSLPGGCDLLVGPFPSLVLILPLTGSGPGTGDVSVSFGLPHSLRLGVLTLQALIPDIGAVRGFSATAGVELTIQ